MTTRLAPGVHELRVHARGVTDLDSNTIALIAVFLANRRHFGVFEPYRAK
jgi:hypothetical protein